MDQRSLLGAGIITTFACTGGQGNGDDGGPATSALLWGPSASSVDTSGNVYIADTTNNKIRMVGPPVPLAYGMQPTTQPSLQLKIRKYIVQDLLLYIQFIHNIIKITRFSIRYFSIMFDCFVATNFHPLFDRN